MGIKEYLKNRFMRKLHFLLLSLLFSASLSAQGLTIQVIGDIIDDNGIGVSGLDVVLDAYGIDSSTYNLTSVTDSNGHFEFSFSVPNSANVGFGTVSFNDCNGIIISAGFDWTPNTPVLSLTFTYCTNSTPGDSCNVIIEPLPTGGILTSLIADAFGTAPFSYLWSTGATTQIISPSDAGTYCVTVTDNVGCEASDCYTLTLNDSLCFTFISVNQTDPSIPVWELDAFSFGSDPIQYNWSNGSSEPTITVTTPGTYCVTTTDANGCIATACGDALNLSDSCGVVIYELQTNTGIVLSAEGWSGNPNATFDYVWSDGTLGPVFTPNDPGQYCVTATSSDGCTTTACYWYDGVGNDSCAVFIENEPTGGALNSLVAYSIGTAPFTYQWSTGENTQSIYPQLAGTYCVTATDATGCVATDCYILTLIDSFCYTYINVIQADPSFQIWDLEAWGFGVDPITYTWDNGQTGPSITVQIPGTYCVTATDANGCVAMACADAYNLSDTCSVQIYELQTPVGTVLNAEAWSGNPNTFFTYIWGDGTQGPVFLPNGPGQYCVTATSSDGCTATACYWYDGVGNDSCQVSIICDVNGGLTAYANGVAPYTYTWSTGAVTQTIFPNDPNQNYCVTITDANGCMADACSSIVIDTFCELIMNYVYDSTNNPIGIEVFGISTSISQFVYEWDNGDVGNTIFPQDTGVYCVTAYDNLGCTITACYPFPPDPTNGMCEGYIEVYPHPDTGATLVAYSLADTPVSSYIWSTGDSTQSIVVTESGTYCVEMFISNNCIIYECITINIDTSGGMNGINGYVYGEPDPSGFYFISEAYVFLYQFDFADSSYSVIDTQIVTTSQPNSPLFYQFDNLENGIYLVQAEVGTNSAGAGAYVPAYHYSAVNWQDANIIVLPNFLTVTNDILLPLTTTTTIGPGIISGSVQGGNNLNMDEDRSSGDSEGLLILLYDEDENVIAFNKTNAEGTFVFHSLPFGTYKVYIEIAGYPPSYQYVTIEAQTPNVGGINFTITEDGTIFTSIKRVIPGLEYVQISPNPASDQITIDFGQNLTQPELKIFDLTGRLVLSEKYQGQANIMNIDIGKFNDGYYIIYISAEEGITHENFTKY